MNTTKYLTIVILLIGCNSKPKEAKLTQEEPVYETPSINETNKTENDVFIQQKIDTIEQSNKFAFVVFTLKKEVLKSQQELNRDLNDFITKFSKAKTQEDVPVGKSSFTTKEYYYTTEIKSFTNFNDDDKYKYMDECQQVSEFKIEILRNKTTIIDRECFVFDSYKDASNAREKYYLENK